ncbi:gliding motility protein GldL [Flaviaesturariibacter aridisoli]|uniref:Gliding motility protein GldL n=1 Tax=Flaviaesturariibacter aridisoli TaxID=2545761 RepID=A0A4R4E1W7_9BACT|nr:gliding motility protein GldL [Flaviaesturariibacter aridisoli]TCZ73494.1 gliding motility protein GldL [Flaviaesturariibacter aridisoli]
MAAAIPPKVSKYVDVVVSIAAALVIYGALQKILHSPTADLWLKIGLYTEAVVFLIYGVLYIIYPAVGDASHSEELLVETAGAKGAPGTVHALDKAMAQADITPQNLNLLGENFKKLNTTLTNMNQIADVVKVTGDYTTRTQEVANALSKVKDAYLGAANSVSAFNQSTEGAKVFNEQMQVLSKNLSSLNTMYELELKAGNNNIQALNSYYGKLAETAKTMNSSAEDAKKVQEQIAGLAGNLTRLNTVYGNMLSAMQGR